MSSGIKEWSPRFYSLPQRLCRSTYLRVFAGGSTTSGGVRVEVGVRSQVPLVLDAEVVQLVYHSFRLRTHYRVHFSHGNIHQYWYGLPVVEYFVSQR